MDQLENEKSRLERPKGYGARHTLAILGFWAFALSYAMRFNISIAIVSMVKFNPNSTFSKLEPPNNRNGEHSIFQNISLNMPDTSMDACPLLNHGNSNISEKSVEKLSSAAGEFNWTSVEQGVILGSFFWGYVITQLPGGMLAHKFGGKWPLGIGLFISGVATVFTPMAARTSKYVLCFVRVLCGLGEGFAFPSMHGLLASWAPPDEKSKLCSIVYAGAQFGTAATMIVSGYLIDGNVFGGWPSVFYVIGGLTIVWFIFWCFFVYDKPEKHPRICFDELNYIENSIGRQASNGKLATPWKAIFTSMPFWAITVGHIGHAWGLYTLLHELPTYLNSILRFDIQQNSFLSALPYILMWISSIFYTQIMDTLISKKILSTVAVRKLSQSIAHVGAAILLIAASYSGCSRVATVTLLTLSVGINGAIYAGYVVNHVDIARNHSATLSGITHTLANITGFVVPYVAGLLLDKSPSLQNWQYVFFIAAAIYIADVLFYVTFASGEEQTWNRPQAKANKPTKV